jgi:predicted NodU family carbamoyl transferase
LQLEDRPCVALAEGLDLRGRRRLVIPRVLQLLLMHVVHGLDLTDQPVLPTLNENSLRCAYLSKSMMSRDMARMLSEEKVVCSKGIKFSSPPSAKRSSYGKSC